jgi:hypothetical protein
LSAASNFQTDVSRGRRTADGMFGHLVKFAFAIAHLQSGRYEQTVE